MSRRRAFAVLSTVAAALALMLVPGSASATITDVFDGAVSCTERPDGTRHCGSDSPRSTVEAFDGVPIDVNVAFPEAPPSGPDGDYPLVMIFHGYGGGKIGFGSMQDWLDAGYATFSMTDRGFHQSCGAPNAKAADPAGCADGYVRLIDNRYEVRDAQDFAGMLADEGLIAPDRIGATGGSYGGGMSMALAALRDRQVMPNGAYVPWESPEGTPMRIAAATPFITWSDLAYSLTPNGSTLDYVADSPYEGRFGVMKESLVNGLYVSGLGSEGFYAPQGSDPSADLSGWRKRLLEGEPYDGDPAAERILEEITTNHSSYYIDHSQPPAPLLLANGFTDDLFPVDEMVRFYNRTRTEYPDAEISLFAGEIAGHPRSQSKTEVNDRLRELREQWFAHYLTGEGPRPRLGVETYTQTCPADTPSGGPYKAANWARIAKGEVRTELFGTETIAADAGDPGIAAAFNPVDGDGACAETDATGEPGTIRVPFDPAPTGGLTLMGSPTVIADFTLSDDNSQVAARLLDVGPDGKQTLVARGLWRPALAPGRQVFQLHPNGWTFEQGHVPTLELLPADWNDGIAGGYGRKSDGQSPVDVTDIEVRLPVVERPGSTPGLVKAPAEKLLPDGYDLAADFVALGDPRARLVDGPLRVKGGKLLAGVKCPQRFDSCNGGKLGVRKAKGKHRFKVARGGFTIPGGESETLSLKLSRRAKTYFARHRGMSTKAKVSSVEAEGKKRQGRKARRG